MRRRTTSRTGWNAREELYERTASRRGSRRSACRSARVQSTAGAGRRFVGRCGRRRHRRRRRHVGSAYPSTGTSTAGCTRTPCSCRLKFFGALQEGRQPVVWVGLDALHAIVSHLREHVRRPLVVKTVAVDHPPSAARTRRFPKLHDTAGRSRWPRRRARHHRRCRQQRSRPQRPNAQACCQ